MKHIQFLIFIAMLVSNCSNNLITSEDQKCRELYLWKHRVPPQETCAGLLGTAIGTGNTKPATDAALFTCFLYLEKWRKCGDESSVKPVIVNTW